MYTLTTTYEDSDETEWDLKVEFLYYGGFEGTLEDPPEPPHVEIMGCTRYEPDLGWCLGSVSGVWDWNDFDLEHPQRESLQDTIIMGCFELIDEGEDYYN